MDLNQRIELEQQTVTALCAIRNNGGNVPDGYVLEASALGLHWDQLRNPDYTGHFYRLTPIKSRFTVSTDPCGVLDSERPGWIAKGFIAPEKTAERLNAGTITPEALSWTPPPKPQIPLGRGDVPPNSVFRDKHAHEDNWIACGGVDETGVSLGRGYVEWGHLKERFLILRPDCDTYHACSKDAP
jgi:hypothetical protein